MELTFSSIEEVKEFVQQLKGTRGGKNKDEGEGNAPAPLTPPGGGMQQQTFNPSGFAPQAGGAGQMGGGPFAAAATGPAPEVVALVGKITARIDQAIASGQPADQAVNWFRSECAKGGVDATNATLDQIKAACLPKLPVPVLQNIAKLMGCAD